MRINPAAGLACGLHLSAVIRFNLAAGLAQKSLDTLLIDLDPQANSTMSFVDLGAVDGNMYDVMCGSISLSDVIVEGSREHLWVAPSRIAMAKLEGSMMGSWMLHTVSTTPWDTWKPILTP